MLLWLLGIFLLTLDVGIFIPSENYKIISYLSSLFLSVALIFILFVYIPLHDSRQKKKIGNVILAFLGFIVLFHFYLVGFFHGFPGVYQYLSSEEKIITKNLVFKYYHSGQGGKCYNHFTVENSFYFGKICTDEETLNKLKIGDKIILFGHQNTFGFYSKKFEY